MGVDNNTRISKFFRRGLLVTKTVYANLNGEYKKTSFIRNNYFRYSTQNPFCSIRAIRLKQLEGWILPQYKLSVFNWTKTNPVFYGDNLLTSSDEYTYDLYDENKYVLKTTIYDYNSERYAQVRSITRNDSRENSSFRVQKSYPTDLTGAPYNEMVNRNIINIPVQEDQYMNNTLLISNKINYKKYYTFFAQNTIESKKGSNAWETRIRFSDYDTKGNVICLSKEGGINTCYLWGYNSFYPVVKIENATIDQIKSVFGGSLPNLGQGGLSTAQNSNLKSALPNALITTYSYYFLDGIKSETDQNEKSIYYEYDSFGRLKNIKNQDLVILKEFNYHYKE